MMQQSEEHCGNCRFFRLNTALAPGVGACRRRPPVWTGPDDVNAEGMFAFPRVSQDNWCGEWEPRGEVPSMLAAIRAAEQDAEITPEIAAALDGERNRATVGPKSLPKRPAE